MRKQKWTGCSWQSYPKSFTGHCKHFCNKIPVDIENFERLYKKLCMPAYLDDKKSTWALGLTFQVVLPR